MKFLYGFSLEIVDEEHPKSPAYLRVRDEWIGSLKKRYYEDEQLMEIMHKIFEVSYEQGRKQKAHEVRKVLCL